MKTTCNQILWTALVAVLPFVTGCLAVAVAGGAAAGAGAGVYVEGELQASLDAPLDKCRAAANQALDHLALRKIREEGDGTSAKIKARNGKDQAIQIGLKKLTDHATRVTIRVGTWGDQAASEQILTALKQGL